MNKKNTEPSPEVWGKFTIQPSRKVVVDTNIFLLGKDELKDFIKEVRSLEEHIIKSWGTIPDYCVELLKEHDLAYNYCKDIHSFATDGITPDAMISLATAKGTFKDSINPKCTFSCPSPEYWTMIYELARLVYKYSSYRLRDNLSELKKLVNGGSWVFVYDVGGPAVTKFDPIGKLGEFRVPIIGTDWIREELNEQIKFPYNNCTITQDQYEHCLSKGIFVPSSVRVSTEMGLFHAGLINHKQEFSLSFKLNGGKKVTICFGEYSYDDFKNKKPFSMKSTTVGRYYFNAENRLFINMHIYNLLKKVVEEDSSKSQKWSLTPGEAYLIRVARREEKKLFEDEIEEIKKSSNYTPEMEYCSRVETAIMSSMLMFYPNPMYESYYLVPEKEFLEFWKNYFSEAHLKEFYYSGKREHMILTEDCVKTEGSTTNYVRIFYPKRVDNYLNSRFILPSEDVTELHIEGDDLTGDDHFTFESEDDYFEVISRETYNKLMEANPKLKSIKLTITLPRK